METKRYCSYCDITINTKDQWYFAYDYCFCSLNCRLLFVKNLEKSNNIHNN